MGILYLYLPFLILFPLLTGLIRFRYLDQPHQIFFYYLLTSFLFQFIHIYVIEIQIKTLFQYLYYGFSFFLLFRMLSAWSEIQGKKKILIAAGISPFFFLVEYGIRYQEKIMIPSYAHILTSLLFCFFAIPLLFQKMVVSDRTHWKNSVFLILAPMILFFLLFDVLQLVYVLENNDNTRLLMKQSFVVYRILLPFSFIPYTFGLLWSPRKEIFI